MTISYDEDFDNSSSHAGGQNDQDEAQQFYRNKYLEQDSDNESESDDPRTNDLLKMIMSGGLKNLGMSSEATSGPQGKVGVMKASPLPRLIQEEDERQQPVPQSEQNSEDVGLPVQGGQQDDDLQSDPGEMLNKIMEDEQSGEASAKDFVDPSYVKESKRGLLSRMFRGRKLSKKRTRGFGDRLKSIGSGLGSLGAQAAFGVVGGIANLFFRAKKAWNRSDKNAIDRQTRALMQKTDRNDNDPTFEELARKRFKYERKEESARRWQLKTGYFASGYGWRKRVGWETAAERWHNSQLAGGARYRDSSDSEGGNALDDAPDWRDARDKVQAVETGGTRFDRDKMARTKQVLALREQLAQLEKQKEQNPAAAADVQTQLDALKEKQAQAEDGLKHVTKNLNTRLTKDLNRSSRMSLRGGVGDLANNLDLEDESVKTKFQAPATVLAPKKHALAQNAIVEEDEEKEE